MPKLKSFHHCLYALHDMQTTTIRLTILFESFAFQAISQILALIFIIFHKIEENLDLLYSVS